MLLRQTMSINIFVITAKEKGGKVETEKPKGKNRRMRYYFRTKANPEKYRKLLDRLNFNERKRRENPDYREKKNKYFRDLYRKKAKNDEWRENYLKQQRDYYHRTKEKKNGKTQIYRDERGAEASNHSHNIILA